MVHDQAAHNSWHTWMRSLHGWMARHRHDQVTSPTSANERDQSPLRRLLDQGSKRQPRKEGRIEVVPESATETVAIRRSRVQQALTSLGTNRSPAKLAQHLHMDVWEVREHLRALEITGLSTPSVCEAVLPSGTSAKVSETWRRIVASLRRARGWRLASSSSSIAGDFSMSAMSPHRFHPSDSSSMKHEVRARENPGIPCRAWVG
jgi:hypothetical protein